MKRLVPLALAVPLLLAGCSDATEGAAPETATTETITTTRLSDDEQAEQTSGLLDSMLPMNQVSDENLADHCVLAIADEMPEAGNFDFPEPIQMEPLNEGSKVYTSTGDFRYEDVQDVWQDGFYTCQIITKNGAITDGSATAF